MTPRPITTRVKIEMRSMERTIRALFMSLLKRYAKQRFRGLRAGLIISRQPNYQARERMEIFMHRLSQTRVAIMEEASRKRPASSDLAAEADPSKRQKVEGGPTTAPAPAAVPASASAPVPFVQPRVHPTTISQLFTLSDNPNTQPFDVNLIPIDIVKKIIVPVLRGVDPARLAAAVNVRYNLAHLERALT
jgi:symplekin